MHLNDLSVKIKDSITASKYVGLIFNTIGVSDGISMGTFGMRYSLPLEILLQIQWRLWFKQCL